MSVQRAARLAVTAPLAVLYVIGVLAALLVMGVALLGLTCGTAVRLGWSDTRKRAAHGSA